MKQEQAKRQANVDEAKDKAATHSERAMSDGTFRNRPLWRIMRPDHEYGPSLTNAARFALAMEEPSYVASGTD